MMRIQDIADILIMTFLVYQLYSWFRKSRALQVVFGLGFLAVLYFLTKTLGLFMTSWILQELGTVILILIIVVFQGEIRQALYRFSLLRRYFDSGDKGAGFDAKAVASAVFSLAARRIGALLVFEREESLDDHLLHGVRLDSLISSQLLASIFEVTSPLHDGAVIIRQNRITEASTHLPLSTSSELPQHFGTRHRAALGLAERTDALVVVVSEERGAVSLAFGGELVEFASPEELAAALAKEVVVAEADAERPTFRQLVFSNVAPKVTIFLLVVVSWLLVSDRQGGLQSVQAPVKFHNVPERLSLKNDLPAELEVQLKVFSNLLPNSNKLEVAADLDLAKIHEGVNMVQVDSRAFRLPIGVSLVKANPASLRVVAEKKVSRDLPVNVRWEGRVSGGMRLRNITVDPARVRVTGPESVVTGLGQLQTEPLSLAAIKGSQTFELGLVAPSPQVELAQRQVRAKVVVGR